MAEGREDGTEARPQFTSVHEGDDATLLERMLEFYPRADTEPIIDVTYNKGKIWKGSTRHVVRMDNDPRHCLDVVGDFRTMRGIHVETGRPYRFPDAIAGVIIFDPPHLGGYGRDKSNKAFDREYGATINCGKEHDWNLSYLYPPFLVQAYRVLRDEGLVFAKICDQVNSHKSKWPHVDFHNAAIDVGFTVCDLIVKTRNNPLQSSKWKNQYHARKRHSFWFVLRKGRC